MQPPADRRKIRVTGKESVADVARVVFKDPRLSTLISDLNPSLPANGPISANTVVTCPSKTEAAAFAKKMGFTLGFDEKGANGTRQRRAWAKMQGPGQASHKGIIPAEAAEKLLSQKLPPPEVGKRLVKLCLPESLAIFVDEEHDNQAIALVQRYVRLHVDFPKAKSRLAASIALLEATLRPAGLLALLQAQTVDGNDTQKLLASTLTPAAARSVVAERAGAVVALVKRARELARIERGARDATVATDPDGPALAALSAAIVDRVEPVSAERLRLLGLDEAWALLSTHFLKLKEMLKKHEELLARAQPEIISTLAVGGDGARLPKPWPVVASVVRGTKALLDAAPIEARDSGLGGLITHRMASSLAAQGGASGVTARPSGLSLEGLPVGEGGPVVSAASLLARAATGAKAVDEGTALAERLAPLVGDLVELYKPVAGDAGPLAMRRAKRKSHFADVVTARGAPQGDAVSRLVDELLADCKRTGVVGADRIQRPQQIAAREVGKLVVGPITVHQKNASEVARAIVVVAMALDREFGSLLLRPTGREAFRQAVERHGGKLLSKSGMVFQEPPKR